MDGIRRATVILQRAEEALRGLVSEAAASGDYETVVRVADWARTINELVQVVPRSAAPETVLLADRKPGRVSQPVAAEYPRFCRQSDQLIRIAWSKKEKREYQHKASYPALSALTDAMIKAGADGRIFSTEQILPLHDAEGNDVPSYQAYVGIALMKQMALIDQHGRQGYSIPRVAQFKEAVEAVWRKLPKQ